MVINLRSLKRQLSSELKHYFNSKGFSEEEIKDGSLYTIIAKDNGEFVDVYIYAEIDVSDFFTINDELNNIVISFDPASYFDIVGPQIYMARIYKSSALQKQPTNILNQKSLIKFGNLISSNLEDEYGEDFWVEDIYYDKTTSQLNVEVFSESYESKASIRIYEEDINSYEQFVKLYKDLTLKELKYNIKNI